MVKNSKKTNDLVDFSNFIDVRRFPYFFCQLNFKLVGCYSKTEMANVEDSFFHSQLNFKLRASKSNYL